MYRTTKHVFWHVKFIYLLHLFLRLFGNKNTTYSVNYFIADEHD